MKNFIIKLILIVFGISFIGAVTSTLLFTYFNLDLPKIDKLQDYRPKLSSQIISKDGVVLADIGLEKREIAQMEEIPEMVVGAFLSAEDDQFFNHKGVDYLGLIRAMLANLKAGRVVQGGSTITQQVAKSLLLSSERSIARKVKDFLLAQKIEEKLTKKEILYLYLNQVYLGGGYYGVKSAAHGYFEKELKQLTVAEAAMIAGLLVAPGKYSPYVNPHAARKRQHYVLRRMYETKKITKDEYENALKEKTIYHIKVEELKAPYFVEWIRQTVVDSLGEEAFLTKGLKIQTSLDWNLQKTAEVEVLKGVKEIDKRQGYKGSLANLKPEEIPGLELATREEIFEKKSSFFTINDDAEKEFEFKFNKKTYLEFKEDEAKKRMLYTDSPFMPGLSGSDDLPSVLDLNTGYRAVVTKVSDEMRLVFVSLAGSPGVIPFDGFKWAHKRSISESHANYSELTKPSTILKPGDLILVEVNKKTSTLQQGLSKENLAPLLKNKDFGNFKNSNYIICKLDQEPEAQGALYSLDINSGEVISYVGGNDFGKSKFNRVVQAKRQPGSSFKPILFAAALEKGYTPASIIMDTPESMAGSDVASAWKPKNYDGEYLGPVTFRTSLEQSRNIPTIKILDRVGVSNVLKFAKRIGFNAKLENNLSLALGTFGVTLRDIVTTYAIFPNGGKKIYPRAIVSIEDSEGKKYHVGEMSKQDESIADESEESDVANNTANNFEANLNEKQVYDPRLAYVMTNLMRGVVLHGTATAAREVGNAIGGKTGTTNDYVDAWFVGFSPRVVTGVWTGFDSNKTLGYGEAGARASLPIWIGYMKNAVKKFGDGEFNRPTGLVNVMIDKKTGQKVSGNGFSEVFVEGYEPGGSFFNMSNPNSSGTPVGGDEELFNQ